MPPFILEPPFTKVWLWAWLITNRPVLPLERLCNANLVGQEVPRYIAYHRNRDSHKSNWKETLFSPFCLGMCEWTDCSDELHLQMEVRLPSNTSHPSSSSKTEPLPAQCFNFVSDKPLSDLAKGLN